MTPPPTIPFSSIDLGERGRTQYNGIESLAELIRDNGLIQPIVLVPLPDGRFGLDAGGRRYHALKLLGIDTLYHAVSSDPDRYGFVLKDEAFATPFQRAMTEIAENLGREDPDWRDQIKMIVRAWKLAKQDAHARGDEILMRDFGFMLGVEYHQLRSAVAVHDDLIANPERYKDCISIRGANSKLLKVTETEVTKLLAVKSLIETPSLTKSTRAASTVSVHSEPEPMSEERPTVIPLTTAFLNCNSLDYMRGITGPMCDHIVTDPDYGVSVERLSANMANAQAGVNQATTADSLTTMFEFVGHSYRLIRDQGFLVFWYDLDHHEKLQAHAIACGFRVQRWPLIWHKTDYFSNADTAHNFTKNMEYAMVCRKPNAVLSQVQKTSIFTCASGATAREFNQPFAKPIDVWRWIYSAICIKGQIVYDPFLGSGSSAVAATGWGLKSVGSEIDPGHYANALMNLQAAFKKLIGSNVTFS